MSKFILSGLITMVLMTSCEKQEMEINGVEVSQNPDWTIEDFKNDYSIQFPDDYEGVGMTGFEGNIFFKYRIDEKVEFNYSFCGPLFCNEYGGVLENPMPESIEVLNDNIKFILNRRTRFMLKNEVIGVLYYNSANSAAGKYYMKQGDDFLEGLNIYFEQSKYEEVESIIKTISLK